MNYFSELESPDYARTGSVAQETVSLEEGPLEQFPHSMEPQLRALGMPTALKKGVVHLIAEKGYTVCKKGDVLSSEQARILRLLGDKQASFKIKMVAMWNKEDGKIDMFKAPDAEGMNEDESDEEGASE